MASSAGSGAPLTTSSVKVAAKKAKKPPDPVNEKYLETFKGSGEWVRFSGGKPNSTWTGLADDSVEGRTAPHTQKDTDGGRGFIARSTGLVPKFKRGDALDTFQDNLAEHFV